MIATSWHISAEDCTQIIRIVKIFRIIILISELILSILMICVLSLA